jgi:hypothetical protein
MTTYRITTTHNLIETARMNMRMADARAEARTAQRDKAVARAEAQAWSVVLQLLADATIERIEEPLPEFIAPPHVPAT